MIESNWGYIALQEAIEVRLMNKLNLQMGMAPLHAAFNTPCPYGAQYSMSRR
jgi:hypothetical protein